MSYNSSFISSPDTPSPIFPDRLIRPLPKRTIKSRLSHEAAESIVYPPSLPSSSLPTFSHYGENGEYLNESKVLVHQNGDIYEHDHDHDHEHDHDHDHDHDEHCPHHHHHCHHDHDDDEDEDDDDDVDSLDEPSPTLRHATAYRSSPRSPRSARHSRYVGSVSKGSISGPDGYEAFENTNNKKKRKIPTSANLSLHHSALANDLAYMAIGASKDGAADERGVGSYYIPTGSSAGLGVQGAGRGRNSKKASGRNPLGVSANGGNLRAGSVKYDPSLPPGDDGKTDQGIISAAIANATALLRKPLGKGQENLGVLEQQPKTSHANSQFTFTCETDAKGMTFPEQSLFSAAYNQRANALLAGSSAGGQRGGPQASQPAPKPNAHHVDDPAHGGLPNAQQKKTRRRRGDVYALAARQRKLQQEYANLQRPPAHEDIWICEFCEYESIFGVPPMALIRQYEIKDRKERRRLAEKRRLLEKAKLKGRKGKKQGKNATKAAHGTNAQSAHQQPYDQQPLDQLGDDDLDYGYDDDPIAMPAPPPQPPSKQAMPGAYSATMGKGGGGGPAGGGTR